MSTGAVFTAPERLHDQVPLASAMLCQDCSMITNAPDGACAYCASRSLLAPANVLDRKQEGGETATRKSSFDGGTRSV